MDWDRALELEDRDLEHLAARSSNNNALQPISGAKVARTGGKGKVTGAAPTATTSSSSSQLKNRESIPPRWSLLTLATPKLILL